MGNIEVQTGAAVADRCLADRLLASLQHLKNSVSTVFVSSVSRYKMLTVSALCQQPVSSLSAVPTAKLNSVDSDMENTVQVC